MQGSGPQRLTTQTVTESRSARAPSHGLDMYDLRHAPTGGERGIGPSEGAITPLAAQAQA